ncbi:MAG: hypothetical protein DMD95_02100 [Candidatus Rokuibacteriota bacterium]|nr:MAG: hypothetical protein DMD95_02100 [Candidatus Rokubacteria bacterium]
MITDGKTEHVVRFHPRRLGHANLFVSDLDRSMRFYNAVCGLEEVRREPAIRIGFLSNGNTCTWGSAGVAITRGGNAEKACSATPPGHRRPSPPAPRARPSAG